MNVHTIISLFHILIFGTLFLYVGIKRDKIQKWLFTLLFYLGIVVFFYHIYKVYSKVKTGKSYWIYLLHIIIIAPLLVWVGYNGKNTSRKYFEILLILGFASIGYHGYYLFQ
jgi:hypothetical protein